MSPQRIQLRRTAGWRKPEGAVLVARPSRWGNPFRAIAGSVVGQPWTIVRNNFGGRTWNDGESLYSSHSRPEGAVTHAIELFRMLAQVECRDAPGRYVAWLAPLTGRDLACWCPSGEPCHADVLLELANPPAESGEATR